MWDAAEDQGRARRPSDHCSPEGGIHVKLSTERRAIAEPVAIEQVRQDVHASLTPTAPAECARRRATSSDAIDPVLPDKPASPEHPDVGQRAHQAAREVLLDLDDPDRGRRARRLPRVRQLRQARADHRGDLLRLPTASRSTRRW